MGVSSEMRALQPARSLMLLGTALAAAACGVQASPMASELPAEPAGWSALPAAPLPARHSAHAFWSGNEVLLLGGSDARPCPPDADCPPPEEPPLRDGAIFNRAAGTWRHMTVAPVPLGQASGALLDGVLYLWVPGIEHADAVRAAFLGFAIAENRWVELEPPPGPADQLRLVAAGSRLVAYHGSHEANVRPDLAYDPQTGGWSELPVDAFAPAYDRTAVWTGRELVVLGVRIDPGRAPNAPPVYSAAALDAALVTWRRLPDSEVAGNSPGWYWAGGSIVNASIGSADGGQVNNWGRRYPFGGMLTHPAGQWMALPDPPARLGGYPDVSVGGSEHVVADGWVLEVATDRWTELTRPPGGSEQGEAVVWAGDRLVVWGGVRWTAGDPTLLNEGWAWVP